MLRKYRPKVIFLSEMMGPSHRIEKLKQQWNSNGVRVSSCRLSAGLALLWTKNIQLELMSFSSNHIDSKVKLDEGSAWIRITGIY